MQRDWGTTYSPRPGFPFPSHILLLSSWKNIKSFTVSKSFSCIYSSLSVLPKQEIRCNRKNMRKPLLTTTTWLRLVSRAPILIQSAPEAILFPHFYLCKNARHISVVIVCFSTPFQPSQATERLMQASLWEIKPGPVIIYALFALCLESTILNV